MEIHSLHMTVTEADLENVVREHVLTDQPIEEFRLRIGPEGILASGVFQMFLDVRFESLWELGIQNGMACARLASIKALGIPGNIFKSAILKFIENVVVREPAVNLQGEWLTVDLEKLAARYELPCRMKLTGLKSSAGLVTILVGDQPPA